MPGQVNPVFDPESGSQIKEQTQFHHRNGEQKQVAEPSPGYSKWLHLRALNLNFGLSSDFALPHLAFTHWPHPHSSTTTGGSAISCCPPIHFHSSIQS